MPKFGAKNPEYAAFAMTDDIGGGIGNGASVVVVVVVGAWKICTTLTGSGPFLKRRLLGGRLCGICAPTGMGIPIGPPCGCGGGSGGKGDLMSAKKTGFPLIGGGPPPRNFNLFG